MAGWLAGWLVGSFGLGKVREREGQLHCNTFTKHFPRLCKEKAQ